MPSPPDLPNALTDRVAFLLQVALARAQSMGEGALSDLGVSGREYGLLAVLASGAPSAQHRVGAVLGIDRTTTMALLSGLEARGLVHRSRDPADRRVHRTTLTDAGEQLRAHAAQVLADCDDRFLSPLPAEDRDHLRHLLQELL